jgi:tetratricopeptide (TPR) repeat protein
MKNFFLVVLMFTAIFAQTSAGDFYNDSKKALNDGNLNLAKDKILSAIEADNSNKEYRDFESKIRNIQNSLANASRSIQDRRFDDAIDNYNKVLEQHPNIVSAVHGLGKAYYYKKDFKKAVESFKKAIEMDSSYLKAKTDYSNSVKQMYKSVKLVAENNPSKGIEMYRDVLKYDPKFYLAHYRIGKIYQLQGNHSEAIKSFDSAISISKNQPKIIFQTAKSFNDLGDTDSAIERYLRAIELDEKYFLAYKNIGDIYLDLKDFDNAIKYLNLAIEYDKKIKTAAYLSIAGAYNEKQMYKNTIKTLTKEGPSNKFDDELYYWYHLSVAYNEAGDCANAEIAATNTISNKKSKRFGGGHYELGRAQWCNGKGSKSKAERSMKNARDDKNYRASAEYYLKYTLEAVN